MAAMFGGFEILEKLGEGGMGAVYKARDPKLDRIVALKVLNPHVASEQTYARFQREMKILAKLHHPGIVRLFTVGQLRNRVYFTMEYIEGESLAALIQKAATWEDRKALVRHLAMVARAVQYAHAQGVIHRDLKPSNVILSKEGTPFLTDFGLAKELEGGTTVTLSGAAIGTAAYMSPEQAEGDPEKIGPASDRYSLGAILYEILTGKPPFEGPTVAAILRKVVRDDPVRPRKLQRDAPENLEAVCLRCLAKERSRRHTTAEELAKDLERALAEAPAKEARLGRRRTVRGALREHRVALAALLLAILGAAIFRFGGQRWGWQFPGTEAIRKYVAKSRPQDAPRRQAEEEREENEKRVREIALRRAAKQTALVDRAVHGELLAMDVEKRRAELAAVPLATAREVIDKFADIEVATGAPQNEKSPQARKEKLSLEAVTSIAVDKLGRKWMLANQRLLCLSGAEWRHYEAGKSEFRTTARQVTVNSTGTIYVLTNSDCLASFDGRMWNTGEQKSDPRYPLPRVVVAPDGHPWSLSQDIVPGFVENNTNWHAAAFDSKGIGWFLNGDGVWWGNVAIAPVAWHDALREGNMNMDLARLRLQPLAITVGPDDTKWVAMSDGRLVWLHAGSSGFEKCPEDHSPAFREARAIAVDPGNRVWVAGKGGLCCFDRHAWRSWLAERSLAANEVNCLAVDLDGSIWAGTDTGVSHIVLEKAE